jgi:hypothetical protein
MPDVNDEWVRQQMQDAKVKIGSGKMVLKLLETWAGSGELSPALAKEAVQVFSKLALGHALAEPVVAQDEIWVPAMPGQLTVGDEVRVRNNAFDGDLGTTHNGRRGKITGLRYGDVIFKSTDGKAPLLDGAHYSPDKLEKRVR